MLIDRETNMLVTTNVT